jgi:hypothetical protein
MAMTGGVVYMLLLFGPSFKESLTVQCGLLGLGGAVGGYWLWKLNGLNE